MRVHFGMADEPQIELEVARADADERRRAPKIERGRPQDRARAEMVGLRHFGHAEEARFQTDRETQRNEYGSNDDGRRGKTDADAAGRPRHDQNDGGRGNRGHDSRP